MVARDGGDPHFDIVFVHEPALGARDPDLGRGPRQTVVVAADSNYFNLAVAHDVDQIVVAPDERRGMRLEKLLGCKKNGFPVAQHLAFVEHEARRVDLDRVELGWLLYSDGYRFGPIDRVLKRVLDIAVSLVVLAFGAFMLVPAAIAVKLQDGGPVFYAQTRVTRGGRHFRILKLRTMRVDAERGGRCGLRRGIAGSLGWGGFCGSRGLTSFRSCSTCCAARCRWWGRGRSGRSSSGNCRRRSRCSRSG